LGGGKDTESRGKRRNIIGPAVFRKASEVGLEGFGERIGGV